MSDDIDMTRLNLLLHVTQTKVQFSLRLLDF
jgi:hypothetical protein